jgi:FAD/FMN-containing dehydrogenase
VEALRDALNRIDPMAVLDPEDHDEFVAAGCRGAIVCAPDDDAAATHMLETVRDMDGVAVPAGRGHGVTGKNILHDRPLVVFSTRRMTRILDYAVEDLTITAQAGASLGAIRDAIRPQGHDLPAAPYHDAGKTLGGWIATNPYPHDEASCGSLADALLEARIMMGNTVTVRSGARTAKSVAGYDLHQLSVGSHGALGLITEATFRLRPCPPCVRFGTLAAESVDETERVAETLIRGSTRPATLAVANTLWPSLPSTDYGHMATVCLGYVGTEADVTWQISQAEQELQTEICWDHDPSDVRELFAISSDQPATLTANSKPSDTAGIVQAAAAMNWPALGHLGSGVNLVTLSSDCAVDMLIRWVSEQRVEVAWWTDARGMSLWLKSPADHCWWLRTVEAFDPDGLWLRPAIVETAPS